MHKNNNANPVFSVQQESFLKSSRTAVFLYLLQDGAVYAMNSFPHLQKLGFLLEAEELHSMHIHEFYEIILLAKGYLLHEVNGSHHTLPPGSLVFVRPYDLHRLLPVNSERTVFASLALSSSVIKEIMSFLCAPDIMQHFNTAPEAPHVMLSPEDTRGLMLQMENISNEQAVSPASSTLMARVLAAQLFASRLLPSARSASARLPAPAWLQKLRQEAEHWTSLGNAPQRLHQSCACHPSHLCKSFQRYYDETPSDFINRLRVLKAAHELKETDVKVAAIAAELGFESLSHFHRLFKRRYGMTPAAYRRACDRT
ncbi:MAG: AraC family transcriptional regulator [Kiritimatiellae bacterium]|nr:AraC family transcriptional regulator [Kiritimatiellia bacterium]